MVKFRPSGGHFNIAHPELQIIGLDIQLSQLGLTPVYPLTEGLKRKKVENKLLAKLSKQIVEDVDFNLVENLPQTIIQKFNFHTRTEAVKWLHAPKNPQLLEKATQRLKFEELFYLQLRHLQLKGSRNRTYKGLIFENVGAHFMEYYEKHMPFELTDAQKRVIKEIRLDMKSGKQMNRLLQGDVGSGKTMVAQLSMLLALDNGYQSCLIAPTEILAQQHAIGITEALEPLGLKVALLTGSTTKKNRKIILEDLLNGEIAIIIGTHAPIGRRCTVKAIGFGCN